MKLALTPPAYCAGCFQHYTDERHVDFEAAYDGPVIPGTPSPVPIDDLILCERCVKAAADKLDLKGQIEELERLYALLERADADIEAKDRMIQRYEKTTNELVTNPVKPRHGAGVYAGISDEIRDQLAKRVEHRKRGHAARAKAEEREAAKSG